jgi:hypothetical protein
MPDSGERPLSLYEWLVLCVVCEEPTYGFAIAGLANRVRVTSGMEHTLALWRHETMSATMQFLDQTAWQAELAAASGPGGPPRSGRIRLPIPREGS